MGSFYQSSKNSVVGLLQSGYEKVLGGENRQSSQSVLHNVRKCWVAPAVDRRQQRARERDMSTDRSDSGSSSSDSSTEGFSVLHSGYWDQSSAHPVRENTLNREISTP